jgi:ABC-type transport system substrate-binding protein
MLRRARHRNEGPGRAGAALILAAVAFTAGCDASTARSRDLEPVTTIAPRLGGEFRLVLEAPHYLDPASVESVYDALPVGQIFDGLVALDPGLHIVPALADTWTISRDGRVYTLHVRDGVRFHDGTPLTADDVVFSVKRLLDPARQKASIGVSYLQVVEGAPAFNAGRSRDLPGVTALDPHQVEIKLTQPYLSFLDVLAMDDLRIVPEEALARMGEAAFRRAPVGTGPFRFESWTDTELRLAANPSYFGGEPYLDQVVIMFPHADEHDGGNARFRHGETEMVEPNSDTLASLLGDPAVEVHRYQDLSVSFLGLNTGIAPLTDLAVRRAIAHAIDRKSLAGLSPSTRREATGILPPGLPSYSPAPKALAFDPEMARRLLAQSGHAGGRGLPPIKFYTAQSDSTAVIRTVERLRQNLAAVGITLDIHKVSWRELNAKIEGHEAPMFQLGWVADLPDPDSFLRTLFEPGGSANYFDFLDDDIGRSLERGALETNPVERARIYREIEKTVLDKAPFVPLFHAVGMIASRKTVHGLKPGPMGIGSLSFEHVWVESAGNGR